MTNEEFGAFLKGLRKEVGLTIRQLEEKSGVSNAYLSQLENGKRGLPSPEILRKIYKHLGVGYNDLMKKAGHITSDLDPETQKIIQMKALSELISNAKEAIFPLVINESGMIKEEIATYFIDSAKEEYPGSKEEELKKIIYDPNFVDLLFENLTANEQIELLNILIKDYVKRGVPLDGIFPDRNLREENVLDILRVPVLGQVAAGLPIFAGENIEEWIRIPNMWSLKSGESFVLKVKGDSMIGSRIYDGDKVIVKVQSEVENGEIAVVNVNGDEATLKRVKKTENGQVILYPDNPKYDPIFITNENARVIGKVIQVMFEPK